MNYVIGFDLAVVVVLVEVGAEVLHQQEVEDFHLMEEVEVLQVQMVALEQAEQPDQVEVLGEVDLRELVVVEVQGGRALPQVELEVVVRLPVELVGLVQGLELAWKQPH